MAFMVAELGYRHADKEVVVVCGAVIRRAGLVLGVVGAVLGVVAGAVVTEQCHHHPDRLLAAELGSETIGERAVIEELEWGSRIEEETCEQRGEKVENAQEEREEQEEVRRERGGE